MRLIFEGTEELINQFVRTGLVENWNKDGTAITTETVCGIANMHKNVDGIKFLLDTNWDWNFHDEEPIVSQYDIDTHTIDNEYNSNHITLIEYDGCKIVIWHTFGEHIDRIFVGYEGSHETFIKYTHELGIIASDSKDIWLLENAKDITADTVFLTNSESIKYDIKNENYDKFNELFIRVYLNSEPAHDISTKERVLVTECLEVMPQDTSGYYEIIRLRNEIQEQARALFPKQGF